MFSILQKSLHSSPFFPNPLCLSAFREVKSCCELFTSAIALFIGISRGKVKSISVFAFALLHIISRNMCQFNDEKSFN